jgi:WhiB family redox-sensing transcriptional regulator
MSRNPYEPTPLVPDRPDFDTTEANCAKTFYQGNLIDPEIWFTNALQHQAVKICRTCPLVSACAEYALKHQIEYGVWGGLTEQNRKDLRKRPRKPIK